MNEQLTELFQALMKGNAPRVKELVEACLEQNIPAGEILEKGMVAAMAVIGEKFKKDEIFMPEVMIAARAMNTGLDVLDPVLTSAHVQPKGSVLLGTVHGDLHDVGKNIVSIMFRGAGFKVIDLGIDVTDEGFVEGIKEHNPDIVAMSALLTMTLPSMQSAIQAIEEANLRKAVIVMVGGAPVTEQYAQQIGADGWAPDAASAVEKAMQLMAGRSGKTSNSVKQVSQ